jgi:hypothetical protein
MQSSLASSLPRWLRALAAATALIFLAGCNLQITDLTPRVLAHNPSNIYTFSMRVSANGNVVDGTTLASIIIDGQTYTLAPSPLGKSVYEFEYQLPAGRDEVKYYYLVNYTVATGGGQVKREQYTDVITARVVNRYVLSLETNRGPVGARISVVGRGFKQGDTIKFDDQAVQTTVESANALYFNVPDVAPGRNYRVTLEGATGSSPVGTFRVDGSTIFVDVQPRSLNLSTGSTGTLTFNIGAPAPAGGQLLDVTTDIPDSIVMPEVVIPEGATGTIVTLQGARPGTGSLYMRNSDGQSELTIPVTVR